MFDFLKDVVVWVSGQTGVTESIVSWTGGAVIIPLFSWIALKIDFAKHEKAIDALINAWKKSSYVAVYGFAQKINDKILLVPGLGFVWEKWLEPFFIKMISGLSRLIVRFIMGIANLITEAVLAFSSGLNSRGESIVKDFTGKK